MGMTIGTCARRGMSPAIGRYNSLHASHIEYVPEELGMASAHSG